LVEVPQLALPGEAIGIITIEDVIEEVSRYLPAGLLSAQYAVCWLLLCQTDLALTVQLIAKDR
jgi:hypothetical protein